MVGLHRHVHILSMFFVDFQMFFSSPVFFFNESWRRNTRRNLKELMTHLRTVHLYCILEPLRLDHEGKQKGETFLPKFGPRLQFWLIHGSIDIYIYVYIYIYIYIYMYIIVNYICCIYLVIHTYISTFVRFGSAFVFMDRLVDIYFSCLQTFMYAIPYFGLFTWILAVIFLWSNHLNCQFHLLNFYYKL